MSTTKFIAGTLLVFGLMFICAETFATALIGLLMLSIGGLILHEDGRG